MRLDLFLANNPDIKTRSKASDLIKRGFITVNGKVVSKAGFEIKETDSIIVLKETFYASRGGEKLIHALNVFSLSLENQVIIDVGASTGGFTDVSLKEGASLVYAYDVGKDQMIEDLKKNPKVKSFEETNILDIDLPEHDLCLIDVSFTSVLPIITHVSKFSKRILFLLKPQFETDGKALKKGILKDEKIHQQVMKQTINHVSQLNYLVKGFTSSPIKGKDGNQSIYSILKGVNSC